ncbi:MAG TPA: triose-phosphate isomerase [Sulfolobales archaeon]|nr:triose-phosphate isomerase [Sulfolobales archaeon]
MRIPVLVINFKTYRTSYGQSGLSIAKSAEKVALETGLNIVIAPPLLETSLIVKNVGIDVYAQHAEPLYYGAYTGHTPIEALRDVGVRGVLVNHSENQTDLKSIIRISEIARSMGLGVIACSDSTGLAEIIARHAMPDAIALEPPELIGSGIAVSKARPEIIVEGVRAIKQVSKHMLWNTEQVPRDIAVLAGAGISSREDVARAIELGAEGVLVASAIMLSKSPESVIMDFAQSMLKAWDERRAGSSDKKA